MRVARCAAPLPAALGSPMLNRTDEIKQVVAQRRAAAAGQRVEPPVAAQRGDLVTGSG
jgi:hypothetical protein